MKILQYSIFEYKLSGFEFKIKYIKVGKRSSALGFFELLELLS